MSRPAAAIIGALAIFQSVVAQEPSLKLTSVVERYAWCQSGAEDSKLPCDVQSRIDISAIRASGINFADPVDKRDRQKLIAYYHLRKETLEDFKKNEACCRQCKVANLLLSPEQSIYWGKVTADIDDWLEDMRKYENNETTQSPGSVWEHSYRVQYGQPGDPLLGLRASPVPFETYCPELAIEKPSQPSLTAEADQKKGDEEPEKDETDGQEKDTEVSQDEHDNDGEIQQDAGGKASDHTEEDIKTSHEIQEDDKVDGRDESKDGLQDESDDAKNDCKDDGDESNDGGDDSKDDDGEDSKDDDGDDSKVDDGNDSKDDDGDEPQDGEESSQESVFGDNLVEEAAKPEEQKDSQDSDAEVNDAEAEEQASGHESKMEVDAAEQEAEATENNDIHDSDPNDQSLGQDSDAEDVSEVPEVKDGKEGQASEAEDDEDTQEEVDIKDNESGTTSGEKKKGQSSPESIPKVKGSIYVWKNSTDKDSTKDRQEPPQKKASQQNVAKTAGDVEKNSVIAVSASSVIVIPQIPSCYLAEVQSKATLVQNTTFNSAKFRLDVTSKFAAQFCRPVYYVEKQEAGGKAETQLVFGQAFAVKGEERIVVKPEQAKVVVGECGCDPLAESVEPRDFSRLASAPEVLRQVQKESFGRRAQVQSVGLHSVVDVSVRLTPASSSGEQVVDVDGSAQQRDRSENDPHRMSSGNQEKDTSIYPEMPAELVGEALHRHGTGLEI
ncbi:hypothetical protein CP532_1036 [Ophiocordyceps camponoti-leonardi (nom. inval.)]|nr:hypothetical protein CP532_1036 [Ophiocordyceps camponoti-leonardi (nom. inval.)]